jgi:hypothetical protein
MHEVQDKKNIYIYVYLIINFSRFLGDGFARIPWFHPRTSRNHRYSSIHWIITGYNMRHYGIVYIGWLKYKFNSCFLQYN